LSPVPAADESVRRKRKKQGGNSGRNFTEGWVEFEDKAEAKRVAASLNGQPMGGRRRSAHYYDLWTIKYLPKFKWDQLTEEINYQRAVKDQRMAAEVSAAKRERDFYLSRVDKAKGVEAIIERRKRARSVGDVGDGGGGNGEEGRAAPVLRTYGQRQAKADPVTDPEAPVLSSQMLQLIAGKRKG
jgi:ESF2/ABP1 family protein